MRALFPSILFVVACSGDEDATTDSGVDTDTDAVDTDTTAGCTPMSEGSWSATGTCFGMLMTGTLTLGADGCSFTLSDWDMAMSVPDGGTVSGSTVTLTGTGWDTCTGTTDGTSVDGSCSADDCTYTMTFDG